MTDPLGPVVRAIIQNTRAASLDLCIQIATRPDADLASVVAALRQLRSGAVTRREREQTCPRE